MVPQVGTSRARCELSFSKKTRKYKKLSNLNMKQTKIKSNKSWK